jgi:hypothetical protein
MYLQIRLLIYYYFLFFIQTNFALGQILNKIIMITSWFINFVRHMLQHVMKHNELIFQNLWKSNKLRKPIM